MITNTDLKFVYEIKGPTSSGMLCTGSGRWTAVPDFMLCDWTVAQRSLAYLPPQASCHADVSPVIKAQSNSFAFEPYTAPAISLYLDPKKTHAQFENTFVHEAVIQELKSGHGTDRLTCDLPLERHNRGSIRLGPYLTAGIRLEAG